MFSWSVHDVKRLRHEGRVLKSEGLEQGIEDQEKAVELAQRLRDFKA
jgi:hypothetical protein